MLFELAWSYGGFEPQTSCMPCKSGNLAARDDIGLYLPI